MWGEVKEVSKEEWFAHNGFTFNESVFDGMIVKYQLVHGVVSMCRPCFDASRRNTAMGYATPGCADCDHGDATPWGMISLQSPEMHPEFDEQPIAWMSIYVRDDIEQCRKVGDEWFDEDGYYLCCAPDWNCDPFERDTLWVTCYGVPVSGISQINGTRTLLGKGEHNGNDWISGLFDAHGYRISFSSTNFTEGMIIDFVKAFTA
jgi:hypothetical protein